MCTQKKIFLLVKIFTLEVKPLILEYLLNAYSKINDKININIIILFCFIEK